MMSMWKGLGAGPEAGAFRELFKEEEGCHRSLKSPDSSGCKLAGRPKVVQNAQVPSGSLQLLPGTQPDRVMTALSLSLLL